MKRRIKKVAVLGSGVMGSAIACHFANIGIEVLLLDIVPKKLNDKEKAKSWTLDHPTVKNRIVNAALNAAVKSKPSPLYHASFAKRIQLGNFDDDFKKIEAYDWVIEVVIENLEIKQAIFEKVDRYRTKGSLVSSNTSGISVEAMIKNRSEDFQLHFCGTHFFNPPRYLELFELIPTSKTSAEVLDFIHQYVDQYLGKKPVLAKDTPAFIANRVGTFSIMDLFNHVQAFGLSISELDKLTGTIIGRAKSATFRTADIVGLDTLVHVANHIKSQTKDEANKMFSIPKFIQNMLDRQWLGAKSKQGFYKKELVDGEKQIKALNIDRMTYELQPKPKFPLFETIKGIDDIAQRIPVLIKDEGNLGDFYRHTFYSLFHFVSHRIPEITDHIYKVDDAMNSGFAWKLGPYQTWDAIDVEASIKIMESMGKKPAAWVYDMLEAGIHKFYQIKDGIKYAYDIASRSYQVIPGQEGKLSLELLRVNQVLWKNEDLSIFDLGDEILNVEFHTKMNTIGQGVLEGLNKALDMAEADYSALIISNEGEHFSAGANVGMIYMLAIEQEYEELDMAVQWFQKTMMRMRYSSIPVIAAPHGMALGGGCELCMHTDKVIAHAELYMGLVEFGVGLIPGGGGTKEFALRLGDELKKGDIRSNAFMNRYLSIGQAKVSTSAYEAFDLGYLRKNQDEVVVGRSNQLAYAKQVALLMVEKGYSQPTERKDIKVLGKEALGMVYVGADAFKTGNYMSEHDQLIAEQLGLVLAGGDISEALTEVSEQYLLDLERQAFLKLAMQPKTLERIHSLITKNKILRN